MSSQLVVYLFTKLADAAIVWFSKDSPEKKASIPSSVVSGNQPSSMSHQLHDYRMFQQQTTADSRFQSQLVLPQRFHGGPESSFHRALPVLAKFDALWRSLLTSPAISLLVPHPRATQQRDPMFAPFTPHHQLSPQKNPSLNALPSQHQWKGHKQPTQAIEHPVLDRL